MGACCSTGKQYGIVNDGVEHTYRKGLKNINDIDQDGGTPKLKKVQHRKCSSSSFCSTGPLTKQGECNIETSPLNGSTNVEKNDVIDPSDEEVLECTSVGNIVSTDSLKNPVVLSCAISDERNLLSDQKTGTFTDDESSGVETVKVAKIIDSDENVHVHISDELKESCRETGQLSDDLLNLYSTATNVSLATHNDTAPDELSLNVHEPHSCAVIDVDSIALVHEHKELLTCSVASLDCSSASSSLSCGGVDRIVVNDVSPDSSLPDQSEQKFKDIAAMVAYHLVVSSLNEVDIISTDSLSSCDELPELDARSVSCSESGSLEEVPMPAQLDQNVESSGFKDEAETSSVSAIEDLQITDTTEELQAVLHANCGSDKVSSVISAVKEIEESVKQHPVQHREVVEDDSGHRNVVVNNPSDNIGSHS